MKIELALPDVILIRELLEDYLKEFDRGLPDEGSLKDKIYRVHSLFDDALTEVQEKNVTEGFFSLSPPKALDTGDLNYQPNFPAELG